MATPEEIVRHELIGLLAKVANSKNSHLVGIEGKVVGESRNMLVIETKSGEKSVPKDICVFSFLVNGKWVRVDGSLLVSRPEDRVKKKFKKW
ncbi:MAG: ribonuclease P protein component 1 [Candidatus Aenigmatarchaeota archaeon]